jgi:hypothetical protein
MIRIGLSAPMVLRLRLRAQISANRTARRAEAVREGVLASLSSNLAVLRRLPIRATRRFREELSDSPAIGETVMQFEERYQDLVNLLCDAARHGVREEDNARFVELRDWLIENYDAHRPGLMSHLLVEPDDSIPYEEGRRARDAFESLFLPKSVDAIINSENVILRIMRTRCALDAYREEMMLSRN